MACVSRLSTRGTGMERFEVVGHLLARQVGRRLRAAQGRPKSGPEDKFRLTPVVPRLNELLGTTARPQLLCVLRRLRETS